MSQPTLTPFTTINDLDGLVVVRLDDGLDSILMGKGITHTMAIEAAMKKHIEIGKKLKELYQAELNQRSNAA